MKPTKLEKKSVDAKTKREVLLPPPSLPPLEKFLVLKPSTESITKHEIARFWRQKRFDEEDHLLAAIKAAARIRARNLLEEDCKQFEESLKDENFDAPEKNVPTTNNSKKEKNNNEVPMGIKDWWTKSDYAELNQPAIESMDTPKNRASTYAPVCFMYKPISAVSYIYCTRLDQWSYFD